VIGAKGKPALASVADPKAAHLPEMSVPNQRASLTE
jgi:hypothetical protein